MSRSEWILCYLCMDSDRAMPLISYNFAFRCDLNVFGRAAPTKGERRKSHIRVMPFLCRIPSRLSVTFFLSRYLFRASRCLAFLVLIRWTTLPKMIAWFDVYIWLEVCEREPIVIPYVFLDMCATMHNSIHQTQPTTRRKSKRENIIIFSVCVCV